MKKVKAYGALKPKKRDVRFTQKQTSFSTIISTSIDAD
jgi:hypothetical protein